MVFYTRINKPVELVQSQFGEYEFEVQDGHYDSKGTETNIRLKYGQYVLYAGYTFAKVQQRFNETRSDFPLSARHRANALFIYEVRTNLRIGFEAAYTGKQTLTDQSTADGYWILSLMAEKMWKRVTVFVNCENMLNVRQSKYEQIYTGTLTDPVFKDIYAPLDGVLGNIGIKISL
jgi:iron complex outermembrane receptor protein